MATPTSSEPPLAIGQARLILQAPNAGSEIKLPALRLSRELQPTPSLAMDRANAQLVWQSLQLTPDELITQRMQLLDAYTKQDSATAHARAARAEAAKLKTKLKELQDTRWQHPAVYSAGAAFVGLAGLWLWERKKRLSAQRSAAPWMVPSAMQNAALVPSVAVSPVAVPEAVPTGPTPERSQALAQAGAPISDPIATSITLEDLQSFVAPLESAPLPFQRPVTWWKGWSRRGTASKVSGQSVSTFASASSSAQIAPAPRTVPAASTASVASVAALPVQLPALATATPPQIEMPYDQSPFITASGGETSIAFDDSQADDLGMEAPSDDFYSSDIGTLQSYNPMRSKLSDIDDAMEQLIEIRIAVQAMVDLKQLPAAKKLLDNHIDGLPHTSAWAYLVHLNLCTRMGQRDAFEDMRKRYREQFNRLAPYWNEVDAAVQTLDTYNRPMAELSAVWHSPRRARTLIATWLLGAQYSRRQFQLPAYYDLLDLYDMLESMLDAVPSVYPFQPSSASLLDIDYSASSHVHLDLPASGMADVRQP